MGSFVTGKEIEVIRDEFWEEFESVTIRKYSQGARDRMNAEIVSITGEGDDLPRVIIQAATVPVLEAGIVDWTFTQNGEEDGAKAPVSREWINKLNPDYADFIVVAIRKLNEGRTPAEKQEFLRQPTDSG